MKYIISLLCVGAIAAIFALCGLSGGSQQLDADDFLRIHIRANSNSDIDQAVKYKVKDQIVETLIPYLAECETKDDAVACVMKNFPLIQTVADNVLAENGFEYCSKAMITHEYFPTRVYQDLTLEEGYYDALIVNLGSGSGDNWWCVVYPAFCFTQSKNNDNFVYISQIWEIIKSVMKW